ncbi:hypothetical protein COP2_035067 [Malus domestica]
MVAKELQHRIQEAVVGTRKELKKKKKKIVTTKIGDAGSRGKMGYKFQWKQSKGRLRDMGCKWISAHLSNNLSLGLN